jgi:AmmeMemoRadiSam system protein A
VTAAARGVPFDPAPPSDPLSSADREELRRPAAAFVSLHNQERLRGCIGHTVVDRPLYLVVAEMARAAAREDTRFPIVTPEEVAALRIEISILSPFFPVSPDQIIPGSHGLFVSRGFYRGLLLPQVATYYHWDANRFLEETCRKAGLAPDAWKHGATVRAFTAEIIAESTEEHTNHPVAG